MRALCSILAGLLLTIPAFPQCASLNAAVSGQYTQDFNTLATQGTSNSWSNNSTISGWYAAATNITLNFYRAGDGSSNTGALYSFGAGTNTERALGSLGSGTPGDFYYGVCLENPINSGFAITSLKIDYRGEQWRNGGNTTAQKLTFGYKFQDPLAPISIGGTGYSLLGSLDFTGPVATAAAAALVGNNSPNYVDLTGTLSSITLRPGERIILRWFDPNDSGNDHGLAIDDLVVTTQSNVASTDPVLSVSSPTVTEGNAGTVNMAFTAYLTGAPAPAGYTFTAQVTGGSAQAPSDYTDLATNSYSIPQGSSSTAITIAVNGDTAFELNETIELTVSNPSAGTVGNGLGIGTIVNDDSTGLLSINQIQGSQARSPYEGQTVITRGIVTYVTNDGYFLQTPDAQVDGNTNTSEGIFVFTGTAGAKPTVGQDVTVTGPIQEFSSTTNAASSSYDPARLSVTEFTSAASFTVNSSGNALPAPIALTAADLNPAWIVDDTTDATKVEALEKYEGMRVTVPGLKVVQSSGFDGIFWGVLPSYAGYPVRDVGIERNSNYPTNPTALPPGTPRFDSNQESIAADSTGRRGLTAAIVGVGQTLGPITGVLDYGPHVHTILPDAAISVSTVTLPVRGVRAKNSDEFTIASMNVEQFTNTPARLTKIANSIANNAKFPDVIGMQEVPSQAALDALVTTLNTTPGSPGNYVNYFGTTTDSGTIHNAFIVNPARFVVSGSATEVLPFDGRAPLVLQGTATVGSQTLPLTIIDNHLKSLIGTDYPAENTDRSKRQGQGIALANEVKNRIALGQNLVLTGDWNSFLFNDGYVDLIGAVRGVPAPCTQVLLCIPDVYDHYLLAPEELYLSQQDRYSYVFRGDRQTLDHILASSSLQPNLSDYQMVHINADYPPSFKNDDNNPIRYSDHDHPVLFLKLPVPQAYNLTVTQTAPTYNRTTQIYSANVIVKNNSATPVPNSTIQVVLKDLPASILVQNSAGTSGGFPYLQTTGAIPANGGTISLPFQYKNPGNVQVTYSPQVNVN